MRGARISVPGFVGFIMMAVFDLVYAFATPCDLALTSGWWYVPLVLDGCSFGMRTGGLLFTAAGALVGFGLGWMAERALMGHA